MFLLTFSFWSQFSKQINGKRYWTCLQEYMAQLSSSITQHNIFVPTHSVNITLQVTMVKIRFPTRKYNSKQTLIIPKIMLDSALNIDDESQSECLIQEVKFSMCDAMYIGNTQQTLKKERMAISTISYFHSTADKNQIHLLTT